MVKSKSRPTERIVNEALSAINLIIYDFDGVMTDNRVLLSDTGEESVFVNRSDGLAVKIIKNMRIAQMIVSTETGAVVMARAKKLDIPFIQSVGDKKKLVREYLAKNKIDGGKVIFVGNDINDKGAMESVGWPIAPADAHREIKKIAKITLRTKGGHGVVRELLDILRDQAGV